MCWNKAFTVIPTRLHYHNTWGKNLGIQKKLFGLIVPEETMNEQNCNCLSKKCFPLRNLLFLSGRQRLSWIFACCRNEKYLPRKVSRSLTINNWATKHCVWNICMWVVPRHFLHLYMYDASLTDQLFKHTYSFNGGYGATISFFGHQIWIIQNRLVPADLLKGFGKICLFRASQTK